MSQIDIKWKLPSPNQVRKVKIPHGMLEGTYEISLGELTDTSGNVLTPYSIREDYDPNHKFALIDFPRLFYSNGDTRGSGIELAQYQHLMPVWQSPKIDQRLHDSLKDKLLYLDSVSTKQGERLFMGKAFVGENREVAVDLSRPHAEIAYSNGGVDKISKYTLWKSLAEEELMWKSLAEEKLMKVAKPTSLHNFNDTEFPTRFVAAVFRSGGDAYAFAGRHPLAGVFDWGARSVRKIE